MPQSNGNADPLLQAIRYLQSHNSAVDAAEAVVLLHRRLQKIAKHPFESKYRIIQDGDQAFYRKIGRLQGSSDFIQQAGFERGDNFWELKASAEAWPRLMQATALLSQAVRENEQTDEMMQHQQQQQSVKSTNNSIGTGKSHTSKSSLKTNATVSTSASSSPVNDQEVTSSQQDCQSRGPQSVQPTPNHAGLSAAPQNYAKEISKSTIAGGALAKFKAVAIAAGKEPKEATHKTRKKSPEDSRTSRSDISHATTLSQSKDSTQDKDQAKKKTTKISKGTQKEKQQTSTHSDQSSMSSVNKDKKTPSTEGASAIAKLKAAAAKAAKENNGPGENHHPASSKCASVEKKDQSAVASKGISKLKAAIAKEVNQQSQQRQQAPSPPKSPVRAPLSPMRVTLSPAKAPMPSAAGSALARFKAAAIAAGKQQQGPLSSSQSRQNPLKLAAMHAAGGNDDDDDDRSVRSERSSVSLRDLALHNSVTNLQNSSPNFKFSGSALSKFKAAAQQVQAQQAMNNSASNFGSSGPTNAVGAVAKFKQAALAAQAQARMQNGNAPIDPRSRFQNAAQMMMAQQRMQAPPSPQKDPRSRFQNAAQMMMTQQKMQNGSQDPRLRFQSAAQLLMMQQQQPRQSPPGHPMSAATRWKMAANAAQASVRMQDAARRPSRVNSSWDGLSYPTSADSDDGLSYPTAGGSVDTIPVRGGVRRAKSFDDTGRPFVLRTDSGRSLMSSSSNIGANAHPSLSATNLALVPVSSGSRRNLMHSASFRSQQSARGGFQPNSSIRNGMMMSQSQVQLGGSRPQLTRENSLSLRDLQRAQVMGQQRHRNPSVCGGSVCGDTPSGDVVSATPKDLSPEQPKEEEAAVVAAVGYIAYSAVNLVTFGELTLDLVTTILSFRQLANDFTCCEQKIDYGALSLAVTIPYFFLIIVELLMLAYSMFGWGGGGDDKKKDKARSNLDDSDGFDDDSTVTVSWTCTMGEALSWVVCVNPFLGCLITWTLMYEIDNKNSALLILAIEGAAIVLMFVTIYLERNELSTCTLMVHLVPLVPFTVTCFVVWYYLEKGGICFIMKEKTYWFEGCEVCADGWPPDVNGRCPDGDIPLQDTYCDGTMEENFCYFSYSVSGKASL